MMASLDLEESERASSKLDICLGSLDPILHGGSPTMPPSPQPQSLAWASQLTQCFSFPEYHATLYFKYNHFLTAAIGVEIQGEIDR